MRLEDIYADTVDYAKRLETMLLMRMQVDYEALKEIRSGYIKPVTNVAKEWVSENDSKTLFNALRVLAVQSGLDWDGDHITVNDVKYYINIRDEIVIRLKEGNK
jgi:hypothetical protein